MSGPEAGPAAWNPELLPPDYFRHLRPSEIFPEADRPLEIDAGCGDGSFLLEMAALYPERDFLGIERLTGRVRKICRKAARTGMRNVRVLCLETGYALGWLLPDGCASRVHLLFPDPWPKKKHWKKRFLQDDGLQAVHRVLRDGGTFLFKTDHPGYFEAGCEAVDACGLFERLPWLDPEEPYPQTDFERQWLQQGFAIHRARWRRRAGEAQGLPPAPASQPGPEP